MSAIEIKNLTHRFRKTTAVNDVSFNVPSGCVFALLGENGAGKSTTIKSLMGIIRPQQGSASIFGLDAYREQAKIRPRIGYIPEVTVLYDWMTVSEIGWFTAGFYPHGFSEQYGKRIREFELDPAQKIKNLSKGGKAKSH
ncbi:MAG: ABC transporter ATP-binding protein [Pirellulaceae bacterium]